MNTVPILLPFDSTAFHLLFPIALILTLGLAHRWATGVPRPPATVEGPVTFGTFAQVYAVRVGMCVGVLAFAVMLVSTSALSIVATAAHNLGDLNAFFLFL